MVEINDESRGTHITNSQIRFKTSMLRSSLCDYSDAYILVSGTIIINGAGNDDAARRLDRAGDTEGGGEAWPPLFCGAKRKNGNKVKSRTDFKAETIKRLSPRLKCYCFSHSRAPRIQNFSCRPTMVAENTF